MAASTNNQEMSDFSEMLNCKRIFTTINISRHVQKRRWSTELHEIAFKHFRIRGEDANDLYN